MDVAPVLLRQGISVLAARRVHVEVSWRAAIKHRDHEEARVLGIGLLARHQVDFLAVHDNGRGVCDGVGQ